MVLLQSWLRQKGKTRPTSLTLVKYSCFFLPILPQKEGLTSFGFACHSRFIFMLVLFMLITFIMTGHEFAEVVLVVVVVVVVLDTSTLSPILPASRLFLPIDAKSEVWGS